jgi:hypothetical protein
MRRMGYSRCHGANQSSTSGSLAYSWPVLDTVYPCSLAWSLTRIHCHRAALSSTTLCGTPWVCTPYSLFIRELSNRYPRFFNFTSRGAHNHTPFHLLVEWSLGGTSKHLDAIWDQHDDVERYSYHSPAAITTDTAFDHLGDGDYYQAYLHFFSDLLLKTPVSVVLEEWIFSPKANFDGKKPEMLNRLLDGILHPMLYLGYGIEFRYHILPLYDSCAQPLFGSLPGLIAIGKHSSVHFKKVLMKDDINRTDTCFCTRSPIIDIGTEIDVRSTDQAWARNACIQHHVAYHVG